jgi:uncharacterized protein YggE
MQGIPGSTAAFATSHGFTAAAARLGLVLALLGLVLALPARADDDRSISVTGMAERRVAPDMATLTMAVVNDALEPADARRDADATVARVLELLRSRGIADGDIDSSSLQVSPQYRWREEQRERQLTGYRVRRDLTVRLTELDLLGELLVALSDAGVNEVQAPRLGLQDPEAVYREVLAAAAENARQRAEVLAETLDVELDGVLSVRTHDTSPPPAPVQYERAMMAADAAEGGAASYQSGDLSFRVQVWVTFALET